MNEVELRRLIAAWNAASASLAATRRASSEAERAEARAHDALRGEMESAGIWDLVLGDKLYHRDADEGETRIYRKSVVILEDRP